MADAYRCELASNQVLYLSNEGAMSAITLVSSSAGQQQQSSSHFTTGQWVAPPALYCLDSVNLVIIATAQNTYYLHIQGNQTQLSTGPLPASLAAQLSQAQPAPMQREPAPAAPSMPPMKPMSPMRPMQMHRNPMSMSMGDMQMSMGEMHTAQSSSHSSTHGSTHSSTAASEADAAKVKRFCAQCGSAVQPGDRFCAYCGDRLT
jgi:NADH pyrophosphatase NudC (nudix superfamily)